MNKKELIASLRKLGIDAHYRQKKSDLERMYELAKAANKRVRPNRVYKPQYKEENLLQKRIVRLPDKVLSWSFLSLTIFAFLAFSAVLYSTNSTFRANVDHLLANDLQTNETNSENNEPDVTELEPVVSSSTGPRIYEKNGMTYVVYDYPMIGVTALVDNSCKRSVCDLSPLVSVIKESITPLIKFKEVDFNSKEGQDLIEKYDVASLPVLLFDSHLRLTDNFEASYNFFIESGDKFKMQVDPYKILNPLPLEKAHYKGASPLESELKMVVFSSFSCTHCEQARSLIDTIIDKYPNKITVYFQHFDRGGVDSIASLAAECGAEQDKFWEMHDEIFDNQDAWLGEVPADAVTIMNRYARDLGLDRTQFAACMDEERPSDILKEQKALAQSVGVKNLPTFLMNQDVVQGIYPQDEFNKIVEKYLPSLEEEKDKANTNEDSTSETESTES